VSYINTASTGRWRRPDTTWPRGSQPACALAASHGRRGHFVSGAHCHWPSRATKSIASGLNKKQAW